MPGRSTSSSRTPISRKSRARLPPKGLTIFPETFKYEGYAWGMAIDLTACVGCNACVVACQAENNIAVVGKEQVLNTREMHWIRIDRYYKGDAGRAGDCTSSRWPACSAKTRPAKSFARWRRRKPMPEGLNNMVYNRCVGTRYCSNNCPYKVRRFNFLLFTDWETESLKLQRNPDVTVRSRGVMEKCTYCVQRINYAKITAEKRGPQGAGRRNRPGVRGGLPVASHHVRRSERSEEPRFANGSARA